MSDPTRDVCPCHGEPWYFNPRRCCAVKRRERKRRYARTERGKERNRIAATKWRASHFRLKVGNDHLGSYPVTPEQRERIVAFRKEQHGRKATP